MRMGMGLPRMRVGRVREWMYLGGMIEENGPRLL